MQYSRFLETKQYASDLYGFEPIWIPNFLFPFQKELVVWSIRKGCAALFADCGLGKTPCQLVWSQNIVEKTNGNILILTPLSVSHQTVQEAKKFDIKVNRTRDGKVYKGINITNYERLDNYCKNDFVGVVCDESSILKNFDATEGLTNWECGFVSDMTEWVGDFTGPQEETIEKIWLKVFG